jgi:S1-C subfamily serine protease
MIVETAHSTGTAFAVAPDVVVTAAHVVDGEEHVGLVAPDGSRQPGRVVRIDESRDIAVLRPSRNVSAPLVVSDRAPRYGEPVYVYGNGLGRGRIAVKAGVVSSTFRDAGVSYIETDAASNPGDSGGPVLTEDGQVVGVVSSKADGEGITVAVAASELDAVLDGGAGAAPQPTRASSTAEEDAGRSRAAPVGVLLVLSAAVAASAVVATGLLLRRRRRGRRRIVIELDPEPRSV